MVPRCLKKLKFKLSPFPLAFPALWVLPVTGWFLRPEFSRNADGLTGASGSLFAEENTPPAFKWVSYAAAINATQPVSASIFLWCYEDLYLGINFLRDKTTSWSSAYNSNIVWGVWDTVPTCSHRTQCPLPIGADNSCIVWEPALSSQRGVSLGGPRKIKVDLQSPGNRENFFFCDVLWLPPRPGCRLLPVPRFQPRVHAGQVCEYMQPTCVQVLPCSGSRVSTPVCVCVKSMPGCEHGCGGGLPIWGAEEWLSALEGTRMPRYECAGAYVHTHPCQVCFCGWGNGVL